MVYKIEFSNTQYQYPYPIVMQIIFFIFFPSYTAIVITDCGMQQEMIRGIHVGLGDTLESQSLSAHLGQKEIKEEINKGYYWPRMGSVIVYYIRSCD